MCICLPIYQAQGHIRQEYQGLRSTKTQHNNQALVHNPDMFPPQPNLPEKTHHVVYSLATKPGETVAYTDLTGCFPYASSRGNQYIMVAYHYDANAILVQPIKDRNATSLVQAWTTLYKRFSAAGVTPTTYVLDNECSQELKNALQLHKVNW